VYVGGLEAAAGTVTSFGETRADFGSCPTAPHTESARTSSVALKEAERSNRVAELATPARHRIRGATLQLVGMDALALTAASAIGFVARWNVRSPVSDHGWDFAAAVALPFVWIALSMMNRAYDRRFVGVGTTEFGRIWRTFLHVVVVTALLSYGAHLELARGYVVVALPLALLLTWTGRFVARVRVRRLRRTGSAMNRVLAVGSAASVRELAAFMQADLTTGLHVVSACLPPNEVDDVAVRELLFEYGIGVRGDTASVREAAAASEAASVAVIAGDVNARELRSIAWQLEGTGTDLIVSSGLPEMSGRRLHIQSVAGLPLLRVDEPVFGGLRRVVKDVFDRTMAVFALVLALPAFVTVAALVRLTSPGPAFYLQTRIGRNGRPFRMIKFRSMRCDADAQVHLLAERNEVSGGVLFKVRDDPRVTPVGKVLRRFSLDELPQLINVVTGSMSLVGPRPPLPTEVAQYGDDVRRRLLVKPGLTGLWQVSGRSDLSWDDAVRLDLSYVENWSFALDLAILARTVSAVTKATGAY
jgi:exopolysaccharide biosynthesis polyprenyl glycosylphosphotransferase